MAYRDKSDCQGDYPVELECINDRCANDTFWTDEQSANDCPECDVISMKIA